MKWLRNAFLILANLFGLLVFFVSSLAVYETITNKAGMGVNMHMYFNMSQLEYIIWNGIISIVSIPIIIFPIRAIGKGDEDRIYKTTILALVTVAILLSLLHCLESFFVGKP